MALEIGTVRLVEKSAFGTPPEQDQRLLGVKDEIYMDELVETVEEGAVRIRFLDGSDLRIGSAAEVTLDRFVYDPETSDGDLVLNIQEGALRLITGQMDAAGIKIVTPTATIGIRGSDVLIKVLALGSIVVAVLKGQAVITPAFGEAVETIVDRLGTATVNVLGQVSLGVPPPEADPGMGRDLGALLAAFRAASEHDEATTDFDLPDSAHEPPSGLDADRLDDEAAFDKVPPFAAIEALFGFIVLALAFVPLELIGPRISRLFEQLTMALQDPETVLAKPVVLDTAEITGTDGGDSLFGSDVADTIFGLGGDDLVFGGAGNDRIFGGPGRDSLFGEAGDDFLIAGTGDDHGYGGEGSDGLAGDAGDDRLWGGAGNDSLRGDAGSDSLSGGIGDDRLIGNDGDDWLRGGAGIDSLEGADGNDLLEGEDGADQLFGSAGLDILVGGLGDDRLYGGDDGDAIYGGAGDDDMEGDAGADLLDGGDGKDLLSGGPGDDILVGGAGDDGLHGGMGNDDLYGGPGKDIMHGDDQDDLLFGGDDDDLLFGDLGDDQLLGEAGDDVLYGLDGDETMFGGIGADTFFGDLGRDVLTGGAGADLFVYRPGDGGPTLATADLITDVTNGTDKFGLTGGLTTFGQVNISQAGSDVAVSLAAGGEILFVIANEAATNIGPDDFVFL